VVIAAHLTQSANATTALWSIIYFWARAVHYAVYVPGVAYARTLCFAVGWLATMMIFLQIVT
jgi:uncharacterized MAPEG superfamily protein